MGDIEKCGKPIRFDYPSGNERVHIPCILTPGHDVRHLPPGSYRDDAAREEFTVEATNHVARIEWDADGRLVVT